MTGTKADTFTAALEHARSGRYTFPLGQYKTPVIPSAHPQGDPLRHRCHGECGKDGHGLWDATIDHEHLATWFTGDYAGRNLGIATGQSHIAVVDLDKKDGKDGKAEWAKFTEGLNVGEPVIVKTPSGGEHHYYADPDGLITSSSDALGLGIDTRGLGGYVVAPGSVVETGKYKIKGDRPLEAASPIPKKLREKMVARLGEKRSSKPGYSGTTEQWLRDHDGTPDARVQAAIRNLPSGPFGHVEMCRKQVHLILLGTKDRGHGVTAAIRRLRELWLVEPWSDRGDEFDDALDGAIAEHGATPPDLSNLIDYQGGGAAAAKPSPVEERTASLPRDPFEADEIQRTAEADQADAFAADVALAAQRLRVGEAAKQVLANEKAAAFVMPQLMPLDEFLKRTIEPEQYLIEGLWPLGGNVVFSAQRKSGKSTLVHNLLRTLVDGAQFLDTFTSHRRRKVALVDLELSEANLHRWLAGQELENARDVQIVSLRGRVSSFNIMDDKIRAMWADALRGNDTIILDPLRPVLDALRLDENSEAGVFLDAFDALKLDAGISDGMIVHHTGHGDGARARGDSRIGDWPDAIWRLIMEKSEDPLSFRYFDAYGRDVLLQKGMVSLYDGHRLAYAADYQQTQSDGAANRIVQAMTSGRAYSTDQIIAFNIAGVSKNTAPSILADMAGRGSLILTETEHRKKLWTLSV